MDFYTDFPFTDLEFLADFADQARDAGYTGVLATENKHDPFLPIAAAARRSRAISLGTGVVAALARNPFSLAQMAWDLHYNSGERFILGICTHQDIHLSARFGIDPQGKHERLVELVDIVREIWRSWQEERTPRFDGRFYSIHACPPGFRPTTRVGTLPRIFLLCTTTADLEIAPRICEGVFLHPMWPPRYQEQIVLPAVRSWEQQEKRTFEVIDGSVIATGQADAELGASRQQARQRVASYWLKAEYDPVYAAAGVLDAVRRFREQHRSGPIDWDAAQLEDLYQTFVCDAPAAGLGARLERRLSRVVTGIFPNIVSDLPRLLPAEVVADVRRRVPQAR